MPLFYQAGEQLDCHLCTNYCLAVLQLFILTRCAICYIELCYRNSHKSKNAVSKNLKYSRYIHLMSNFLLIHFHTIKGYMYICLIQYILQLWKRIDHLLITSGIFQNKRKYSVCDFKCRYCIFTLRGRIDIPAKQLHCRIV